jgi:hypothetical protein
MVSDIGERQQTAQCATDLMRRNTRHSVLTMRANRAMTFQLDRGRVDMKTSPRRAGLKASDYLLQVHRRARTYCKSPAPALQHHAPDDDRRCRR